MLDAFNIGPISVGDFNALIDRSLRALGEIQIVGEITELRVTSRKGVFITLKDPDANAILSVSGYAPTIAGIDLVEEGMQVVVAGVPSLYAPYGKFSLQASVITPHGEGALKIAYEKLQAKLAAEGLFEPERKKAAPRFFQQIALITAADSAAYGDFVKVLGEQGITISVDLYPVAVQGKNAVAEILAALGLVASASYDAVVMIRGGGSLEDLIAFNDENIVRQLSVMPQFTIVGVGHERDESLSDFVADWRASTPTQSAVMLAAHNQQFIDQEVADKVDQLADNLANHLSQLTHRVDQAAGNIDQRLQYALLQRTQRLQVASGLLVQSFHRFDKVITRFHHLEQLLHSLSPEQVLRRGYAYLTDADQRVVSSVNRLKSGQHLQAVLQDGRLSVQIQEVTSDHKK